MSVKERVHSDDQLARLLQIGVVLEEVVEARAYHHYESLDEYQTEGMNEEVIALLEEAREESASHREQLETLLAGLDVETIPYESIESLVTEKYGQNKPEDFDGVLYDQLASEETAYKFYDDVLAAIENSEVTFSIERDALLGVLREIREEEAEGVEEVTALMEREE